MEDEKIYITKGDAVLALLEKGQHSKRYKLGESWELNLFEIQEAIDAMPAADVQSVNQWISVNDRLPKSGQNVLIYYPKWDGDEIQVARLDNDGMTFDICGEFNVGTGVVTHWMPLPESPKDGIQMADEYIRLDTTIIAIDNLINEVATGTMVRTLFKAKDTIYSQQRYVIDVQPVKHGRWITKAEDYYKAWQDSGRSWDDMPYFITGEHIACSECFTEYNICTEGIEHWTGCPCCLARMDGDKSVRT